MTREKRVVHYRKETELLAVQMCLKQGKTNAETNNVNIKGRFSYSFHTKRGYSCGCRASKVSCQLARKGLIMKGLCRNMEAR
jgi:hypothetical protein